MESLESLPTEVLIHIALQMDIPEVLLFCEQSKSINSAVCANSYFWRRYYNNFQNIWTPEKAEKAKNEHYYIKLDTNEKGRIIQLGQLTLSGLPRRPGYVYVPALRVAGNPSLIKRYFIGKGFSREEIDKYLVEAYTINNYQTTMKEQYDTEAKAAILGRMRGGRMPPNAVIQHGAALYEDAQRQVRRNL